MLLKTRTVNNGMNQLPISTGELLSPDFWTIDSIWGLPLTSLARLVRLVRSWWPSNPLAWRFPLRLGHPRSFHIPKMLQEVSPWNLNTLRFGGDYTPLAHHLTFGDWIPRVLGYPLLKFHSEFTPEKLPKPNGKGLSSSPINFEGRTVKLRGCTPPKTITWLARKSAFLGQEIHLHSWLFFRCHVGFRGCSKSLVTGLYPPLIATWSLTDYKIPGTSQQMMLLCVFFWNE